jgi:hypothetical protein
MCRCRLSCLTVICGYDVLYIWDPLLEDLTSAWALDDNQDRGSSERTILRIS